ncbi:MAG: NADH:ubiquinone oxidoreductase subunit K [Candidatus Azotimanducaceae bacterium]|jgi:NADH:ubiquinone oxidoreductase subunit K
MTRHITKAEFQTLQQRIANGVADISVPKQVARHFYSRVSNEAVFSITSQSIALKKAFLYILFSLSIGMFAVCLGLILTSFNWSAAIAIPAVGIFWAILTVLTSDKGNQWVGHLGLLASLLPLLLLAESYSYPAALFGISIWLHRCLYFLSQYWLEALVKASYDAFDMMTEHINVDDSQSNDDDEDKSNTRVQ